MESFAFTDNMLIQPNSKLVIKQYFNEGNVIHLNEWMSQDRLEIYKKI